MCLFYVKGLFFLINVGIYQCDFRYFVHPTKSLEPCFAI